jgi:triacylglycerol lipase
MAFRPSRRQVLSSLVFMIGSGAAAVPLISSSLRTASAHPVAQTPVISDINAPNIRPLSDVRQNSYPIVLVHGFAGFGRDGFHGLIKYWGGLHDIQQDLVNLGFPTLTAAIGPFSSNWDRTCELFAQIKGGRVDYGEAHARKFGHARFGRTFPGLFPQWGEINPRTGRINKVHLIGHSMGGQTVRQLAQLLEQGSAEERAVTPPDQLSSLFAGGKTGWIDSMITISSTHNGTSTVDLVQTALPIAPQLLAFFGSQVKDQQLIGYDFNLDQWGLVRQPGESLAHFLLRINTSSYATSQDIAEVDLSPDGASAINGIVRAQPDIFHFSIATLSTHRASLLPIQVADKSTSDFFVPLADFMGAHTKHKPGHVPVDPTWWPNDGLVNTNSMAGPTVNSTDVIVPFDGEVQRGRWHALDVLNTVDHLQVVGFGSRDVRPLYRNLAAFLASLPQ